MSHYLSSWISILHLTPLTILSYSHAFIHISGFVTLLFLGSKSYLSGRTHTVTIRVRILLILFKYFVPRVHAAVLFSRYFIPARTLILLNFTSPTCSAMSMILKLFSRKPWLTKYTAVNVPE